MSKNENAILSMDKFRKELNYWNEKLKNGIEKLDIPIPTKNKNDDYKISNVEISIPKELSDKIIKISRDTDLQIFIVLNSILKALFYKVVGKDNITFMTPVLKNSKVDMFNKAILLNDILDDNMNFKRILTEIKNTISDGYNNSGYPLDKILESNGLNIENIDSIVNVGAIYENIHELEYINKYKFELMFVFVKEDNEIKIKLRYDENKFEKVYMESFLKRYIIIAENLFSDYDMQLKDLSILLSEEKNKLLNEFNKIEADYQKDKTIQEVFQEQVEKAPDNIAVVYEDKKLTYKELNEKSNSLARILREKGVKADTIVGIMVDRSLEMMISIMGILKAGGAYLPIDPEYPEDRIKYMLEDSETKILLTQKNLLGSINYDGEVIDLENSKLYEKENSNLDNLSKSNNLAYVIYTSGTTGKPKGVLIEHRNVISLINALFESIYKNYKVKINVALVAPYVFDASVKQIFPCLALGNALFIVPKDTRLDGNLLLKYYEHNKIDVSDGTPMHINMLINSAELNNVGMNVKRFIIGGDALKVKAVENFYNTFNSNETIITNIYGPTECCVDSTAYHIDRMKVGKLHTIPIGKPINNSKIYILGKNNSLLPVGVAGELCITGNGLSRGYLNKEDLTREKFVDNPYEPGRKMYRTGDLARWLPDGNIEYLGRADNQVKIRGFRIEIGEIENQLSKLKEIKEAVVVAKSDNNGDKYLCGYITAEQEVAITSIKEELSKELPAYMIPNYMLQIDKIPLTTNGKIDKKALPEIDMEQMLETEYEAPGNEIEEKLVEIWEEVLDRKHVGINDNYFDLGGHSLKAVLIISKIKKELKVEIKVRELFENPTIKALGMIIESSEKKEYITINKAEEKEFYKASSAEKRIFTLWQMDKLNTVYNIPMIVEIEEQMDNKMVEKALNELVKRHEALRTSFHVVNGEIVQKIEKEWKLDYEYEEASEKAAKESINNFIRPFDLTEAPLIRSKLVKCEDKKYIFMLDVHHIATDGVSNGILMKEFVELYRGEKLKETQLQYKDYSEWQSDLEKKGVIKRQEEYWLNRLRGELPILNVVTDYERPNVQSYEGDRIGFSINKDLKEKLNNTAKETGTTLYMILLAAYNVMLSKYSGQEDIIVGTAQAGRSQAELENTVGMFVNTIALRNYPSGNKTFREFLEELKNNTLRDFENLDYQFDDLVNKLNLKRDISRNPLFDVMFVLENMNSGVDENAMKFKPIDIESELTIAKFDLTLAGVETDNGMNFSLEYCTKLFKNETIERMKEHYINILNSITSKLDSKIYEMNIMSAEEKNKLLHEFNKRRAEYKKDKTIQELFEEQVKKAPNNIAVVYEDKKLTYKELNEKSNALARVLREKGVKADTIVGIMVDRSLEMMIAIMGIIKAGGAYLPIDPEYPEDRIKYMLEDSKTKILLTQNKLLENIKYDVETIDLEDSKLYEKENSNLDKIIKSNNLAYVIYTSGTTGKPKGVLIEHRNVISLINALFKSIYINYKSKLNVALVAPYVFDASVKQIFPCLALGNTLFIVPKDTRLDGNLLLKYYDYNEVDVSDGTPMHINMLINSAELNNVKLNVKQFIIGGDAFSIKVVENFYNTFNSSKIVLTNIYGPTECCVDSTAYHINNIEQIKNSKSIPIGKPIINSNIFIVDKNRSLLPIGVAGELCISGDGLSRGYLNKEELTKEKFVDNPFEPGTKMYRTGDLARWLPDGNIEYLGRIDNQVKIRGFRIEIGEIENQLSKLKEIKEAVVVAKTDNNGDKYLCGYITAEQEVAITSIKEELSKELPAYMIPSYIVQIDKLPLTTNGKLDRKALPEIDIAQVLEAKYEAPENEIQEKLVEIWEEALDRNHIGINDNYFDLGGHSLKAVLIVAKIKREFEIEIKVREIFENPNIKALSAIIEKADKKEYITINKAEEKKFYKASSAEKRIFTLWEMDKFNTVYNVPMILEIKEKLNEKKVEIVLNELIRRHEALRTSFEVIDGEIVQRIHKEWKLEFQYEEANKKVIKERIKKFIRPFDLAKAPLIRSKLIKCKDKKYIFMLDVHHIVTDGVSMGILMKEFMELYVGENLREPQLQYKDYSEWQNNLEESGVIKKQEEYWLNRLSGELPVLDIIADYERPKVQSYEGNRINFTVNKELKEKLNNIAKETGTTLYMVLLAAYNVMLARYSGQEDIIVGTVQAGRSQAELADTVGMFVNTVALRNYPEGNKTFKEFLKELKDNTLRDFENLDYQFDDLVNKLDFKRDMSRNPLFDVMFVIENMDLGIEENNMKAKVVESELTISKFDLILAGAEVEEGINFSLEYCTKLFKEETIERMKEHYINILTYVVGKLESRICEIDLISKEEKDKLLNAFNRTKAENPKNKTIVGLFEEQVEKTPDNIAVVYKNKKLTYKELNEKSNALARTLRGKGVKAETIVGIMVDRSIEMIIGIMGILKTGGAYLPIDLEYPEDRIKYMLEDSSTRILLTQNKLLGSINYGVESIDLEDNKLYEVKNSNLGTIGKLNDLAYVIYTSGTTGKPKGVMVEQKALVNLCLWHNENYEVTEIDRATKYAGFGFDASVWEIFPYIIAGAALHIIDKSIMLDKAALNKYYEDNQITISFLPTQMCEEFMNLENKSLRKLLTGADKLKVYKEQTYELINNYGPTENAVVTTSFKVDKNYNNIPIGKPIRNSKIYILGANNVLMPIGTGGELCVSGDGLARGYLNREELTKEKFVDNPFEPGTKMYRTGDLARWLPDGNIEYLGRIDNQVKIRGFRIEIGEIENQLLKIKEIKEAVIVANNDENGEKYLCGYVTSEQKVEIAAIKEELSKEIPSYMVPGYILQIEKLPLTPNGKIDRKALPAIDISAYKKEYVAPRNELEKTIVKMFKDILGIKKIGTYDEFTLLGGTSILAIRLVYELNKKGISIDLKTVFSCQSPSKIAEYIKTQNNKIADGENRIVAKLRTSDSKLKSNLIMLPPAGGTIMGYMDMANSAKGIGDIYALEDPRLSGKEDNYSNNDEKLVKEYVSAVKSVFRPGIDYIGGHSFGGNLAFKITSELEKQGISPKGLVIIDSLPENNPDTNAYFKMSDEKLKAMVVVSVMEELLEIEETELEKMKTLTYEEVKKYLREKAKDDMMLNALLNESFLDLYVKVHTDNIRMYNEAELVESILAIPIIVFKASQSKSNWEKYTNWTKYTNKNCQIIEVPGKHISMLRSPNVETMIKHLEKIISNID